MIRPQLNSITRLARAGALEQAWTTFHAAGLSPQSDDPDVLTVYGRLLKDRAAGESGAAREELLNRAITAYERASALSHATYPLINAATLAYVAGRHEAAVTLDERDGAVTAVRTPYGHYRADAYLLAAGAWSGFLEDIPVTPVKGEMIALAAPQGFAPPVIWGNGVYMVPREGRLLVGATVQEAGFDTALTDAARDHLRARAAALIPACRDWPLAEQWAGLRPKSPDGLPLLGPSRLSNLFVAGGQYRNGILFAPAIADRMAKLMQGRGGVIPDFDPRRFAKEPA